MKLYFFSSILFSVFLTLLVIKDSYYNRMLLLIPTLFFFFLTLFLFAYEYDKQNILAWKKKEQKIKNETYLIFLSKYFEEKVKNIKN